MERVFYKTHDKVSKVTLRYTTAYQRSFIETTILFLAVISFSAVILCHRTFVYRGGAIKSHPHYSSSPSSTRRWNIPKNCLDSVVDKAKWNDFDERVYGHVDVTHVVVYNDDNVDNDNYNKDNKDYCDNPQYCRDTESKNNNNNDETNNKSFIIYIEPLTGIHHSSQPLPSLHHHQQQQQYKNYNQHQSQQQLLKQFISNHLITYSFSSIRGYLFLSPTSLSQHNISSQYIFISTKDVNCFSHDPFLQYVGSSSSIQDTIVLNWILGFVRRDDDHGNGGGGNTGFIQYKRNGLIIDLEDYLNEYFFRWPSSNSPSTSSRRSNSNSSNIQSNHHHHHQHAQTTIRWHHHFVIFKIGVFLSSLFLFFATTTLVSFTLRETQNRMLHFTFQLQTHIRRRLPISGLIFTHVVENMVFAPIMLGIIFFLTDCCYNGDKFLSFVILSGVWICEVFSAISMRTIQSSIYYPQVFFAYFTLFHIYYFSCPFGFSYAALMSTVLFQLHSMIFFWNRYELPAIMSGQISFDRPRMSIGYNDHYLNNAATSGTIMPMSSSSTTSPSSQPTTTTRILGEGNIHHYNQYSDGGHGLSSSSVVNNTGQEMQRLRSSYPSMSSLGGRISSYDGYWMSLDGDVIRAPRQQ